MHCRAFRAFLALLVPFFSSVSFTVRGLQAAVFVNLASGLATSPWFRLVSGLVVSFSEGNLLCSFVFQCTPFILFNINLLYFILFYSFLCIILFYS